MNKDIPNFLYRYQALNAHSLASLVNNTIWLSNPDSFNDPFDCAITLDRKKYEESIAHVVSVALEQYKPNEFDIDDFKSIKPGDKKAFENFRNGILELIQNWGICSFSALPDHMLLWSHYANNHRGFCVEYNCREGSEFRKVVFKVNYENTMPSLSAKDFGESKEKALDILWLTKAKCWSYEEEWRVMMPEGNRLYKSPEVYSVIFGARMPESERKMLAETLRHQPEIIFKEAVLAEGEFRIEIVNT
jgi:hypothetical protein